MPRGQARTKAEIKSILQRAKHAPYGGKLKLLRKLGISRSVYYKYKAAIGKKK